MANSKGSKPKSKKEKKIATVLREFSKGLLHSGSKKGPKVKSRKKAVAIALSEAGKSKPKKNHGKKKRK